MANPDLPTTSGSRSTGRAAAAVRALPLTVKVIFTLALVLWPLGVMMVAITMQNYARLEPSRSLTTVQLIAVGLPALMWLLAVFTGWWMAHHFVVGPLRQMCATLRRYSMGDTSVRLSDTRFYTREMDEFAAAFDAMALDLGRGEREMRVVLAEQQRLTREVHHRVKNNLQIVASLLSIQSRDAPTPEVAAAYAAVQVRVGALALVHRWMYGDEGQPGINLKALVTDLGASLEQALTGIHHLPVHVRCAVADAVVNEDLAVPVAFLLTELVSGAARLTAPEPLEVGISGIVDGGRMTLSVTAPVFNGTDIVSLATSNPAARIITGMARQLRSPLIYDATSGSYSIAIPITVRG